MKNRYELRNEYAKYGIEFVYNDRIRTSFLTIMGAPTFVEGVPGAQATGWYRVPGGIRRVQDVEILSQRAKDLYRKNYSDNLAMLQYLDNINSLNEEPNLNSKLKPWYLKTYPNDSMGQALNDEVTFNNIADALNERNDLRLVLGSYDSALRERVFDMLSKVMYVSYDAVYNKWLAGDKEPNIVLDELACKIAQKDTVANGFHIISVEECMDEVYGASIVQYGKEDGLVSFAFSSVGVNEVISRPELVLAEIIRNEENIKPPVWSDLSKPMLELVTNTVFDMNFIENDDELWTEERADKIWDESVAKGLDGVVRTGEDGCLITVYAGAMGSVNWVNHPIYGKPYLENLLPRDNQLLEKKSLNNQIHEAEIKSTPSTSISIDSNKECEPTL